MFTITKSARNLSMVLMAVGLISLIFGFATDAHSSWPSLLFNNYFFLGISVFAVFFIKLVKKYILVRVRRLPTLALGHYAAETQIYLLKKK